LVHAAYTWSALETYTLSRHVVLASQVFIWSPFRMFALGAPQCPCCASTKVTLGPWHNLRLVAAKGPVHILFLHQRYMCATEACGSFSCLPKDPAFQQLPPYIQERLPFVVGGK
jgi:hypothetical protein